MRKYDILTLLLSEDSESPWCGPDGLFQKAAAEITRLRDALREASDLIDGYVDIDGNDLPNSAMRAQQLIAEVINK